MIKYSSLTFDIRGVATYLSDPVQKKGFFAPEPLPQIAMVHVDETLTVLGGENDLLRAKADRAVPIMFVVHPRLSEEQKQGLIAALHPNPISPAEKDRERTETLISVSQDTFRAWGDQHPPVVAGGRLPSRRCVFCKNTRELKKFLKKDLPNIQVDQLPNKLIDAPQAAIWGRKHAAQKARQEPLTEVHTPTVDLWCGDFMERGAQIPDHSVDVIFTDPPYHRRYLPLWESVAVFSARVLKPGGLAIFYSGKLFLNQVMEHLNRHLQYVWMVGIEHTGGSGPCWGVNIRCCYKPILIYGKPPIPKTWKPFDDLFSGGKEKGLHDWQQSAGEAAYYLKALGCTGTLVDPMMGSGSTIIGALGLRQFDRILGIEIEPETFHTAEQRMHEWTARQDPPARENEA